MPRSKRVRIKGRGYDVDVTGLTEVKITQEEYVRGVPSGHAMPTPGSEADAALTNMPYYGLTYFIYNYYSNEGIPYIIMKVRGPDGMQLLRTFDHFRRVGAKKPESGVAPRVVFSIPKVCVDAHFQDVHTKSMGTIPFELAEYFKEYVVPMFIGMPVQTIRKLRERVTKSYVIDGPTLNPNGEYLCGEQGSRYYMYFDLVTSKPRPKIVPPPPGGYAAGNDDSGSSDEDFVKIKGFRLEDAGLQYMRCGVCGSTEKLVIVSRQDGSMFQMFYACPKHTAGRERE